MYLGWNDYELIYLIREGNDRALNLMYHKYTNFIRLKAYEVGFRGMSVDDCIQEGLILLTKAIKIFNDNFNKSFWSYYNLILKRRLWRLKREDNSNSYLEITLDVEDDNTFKEKVLEYSSIFKDSYLAYIYKEIYYYNTKVNELALKLRVPIHRIYRDIKKIKEMLRLEFDL